MFLLQVLHHGTIQGIQGWDKVYLFVAEIEDTRSEFTTTFIVYTSLLCPKVDKSQTIPRPNFGSPLATKVVDGAHKNMYFFYNARQNDSSTITTFALIKRKIIFGEVRWEQH